MKNLKQNIVKLKSNIENCKSSLSKKRRELTDIETEIIELKEKLRIAEEQLYTLEQSDASNFSEDEWRDKQVEDFRLRMNDVLKKIENEEPLEYIGVGDLVND
jgi:chromosome segregation ATPase